MDILKIRAITLFFVAFLNLCLFAVLLYKSKKDKSRIWLGLTAFFSALYAFFSGATYFFWGSTITVSLIWYKTTWLGILIIPCFVIFTYYFSNNIKNLALKAILLYI